jgi:hypothetical protein
MMVRSTIPPKRSSIVACGIVLLGLLAQEASAQTLGLPPRPPNAPNGADFARSLVGRSLVDREQAILDEILRGNVPSWLRELVPVTLTDGPTTLIIHVTPDYLAVGSDHDYFLTPLSPTTAQQLADRLGCALPTPKMVDAIYDASTVKLEPSPIPPTSTMTTIPVFLDHNRTILEQKKDQRPGALVAGHKKDVVISKKVFASPGKVAIYGWHRATGKPIQPLYTGHSADWVDYSHGVRLIQRSMLLDGMPRTMQEILNDPKLAPLLSDEGVMSQTRYLTSPLFSEGFETLKLDRGVRVLIDRPDPLPINKPVLLVFYALPNGNTIEQTIGKIPRPGDDWHFDIQHIGAQTQFIREVMTSRSLVVAYLENDLKSWPAWRKVHGDGAIAPILDAVRSKFAAERTRIVLAGHSGGGSLIFGNLNEMTTIPDSIERIAFLDANYAYETDRHRDKLVAWLKASDRHFLCVLAYNDAVAVLDGKSFVSEAGGTWGKSRLMIQDLDSLISINETIQLERKRFQALGGRVEFLLTENPDRKILHTVQVERNGFIEAMLSGTNLEGVGYTYMGDRAYSRFLKND